MKRDGHSASTSNINTAAANHLIKNVSYAQAAAKSNEKVCQSPHSVITTDQKLDDILKLMTSFDERLKKIENSAKTATFKSKK